MASRVNKNDREVLKYRIERNAESPTGYFRLAEQLLPEETAILADGRPMSKTDLLVQAVTVDRYYQPAWRLLTLHLDNQRREGHPSTVRFPNGTLITLQDAAKEAACLAPDAEVEAILQALGG